MTPLQRSRFQGIGLILLGALLLFLNTSDLRFRDLWPLVLIGIGLYFIVLFLSDRSNYGVLMPASVLLVMGGMFQYCALEGWWMMQMLWPFFLIGPGLRFLLMYAFGKKEAGLLIPGYILTGLGVLFMLIFAEGWYLWPLLLVAAGVLILLHRRSGPTTPPPAGS